MAKIPTLHPTVRAWLLEGPLSVHVPAYVARLRLGRYATNTSGRCLNGVAHFAHWMSMRHLPVHMLDEGCIDQFLRYHLPRCDCPGEALRTSRELHAALVAEYERKGLTLALIIGASVQVILIDARGGIVTLDDISAALSDAIN